MNGCPSIQAGPMATHPAVLQRTAAGEMRHWMWRFDRANDGAVAKENFWGKTMEEAVSDLSAAANLSIGLELTAAQVEFIVDPYFPSIPVVEPAMRGRSAHRGGMNRGFLDGHAKWFRDARLKP